MAPDIRPATHDDTDGVARLVSSLGYPTSAAQMRARLAAILRDAHYATLVACAGGEIVGFIGTRVGPIYEGDGPYGQVMALSIAEGHRRRGIGGELLRAAEGLLAARGVRAVVVTSGNQRADAHAFYEKHGYTFNGRRYRKAVGA